MGLLGGIMGGGGGGMMDMLNPMKMMDKFNPMKMLGSLFGGGAAGGAGGMKEMIGKLTEAIQKLTGMLEKKGCGLNAQAAQSPQAQQGGFTFQAIISGIMG